MNIGQNKNEKLANERTVKDKESLSEYFREKRKELQNNVGFGKRRDYYPIEKIAESLGISKDMLQKKLNRQKPITRDWLIAICAAYGLNSEDTDKALTICNMPRLDAEIDREDYLIGFLDELFGDPVGIDELNQKLFKAGHSELDINHHRNKNDDYIKTKRNDFAYRIIKTIVRTYIDEGDQFSSLETAYDFRQRCEAVIFLEKDTNTQIVLISRTDGSMIIKTEPCPQNAILPAEIYTNVEETGEFADYFLYLNKLARKEQQRVEQYLNDTKNYRGRLGANLKNDTIHIFYEEYNYSMPERNEYYLMEYVDGHYCLSVSNSSMFMKEYLSDEEYSKHYHNAKRFDRKKYVSLEEIENELNNPETGLYKKDILLDRKRAFKALQKKVSVCLEKLKDRTVFIRNLNMIWDNQAGEVCCFYNLKNEFDCSVDENGEIIVGKLDADIIDNDGSCVKISINELMRAFELGFTDSEQICRAKKFKGTVESVLQ